MSKASEWAASFRAFQEIVGRAPERPAFFLRDPFSYSGKIVARVAGEDSLEVLPQTSASATLCRADALAFAKWIIETFDE